MFVFGARAHLFNVKARLLPQCGDCVRVCAYVCVCERERGGVLLVVVSRGCGIPSENKVRCVWWKTGASVDELERRRGCDEAGATRVRAVMVLWFDLIGHILTTCCGAFRG